MSVFAAPQWDVDERSDNLANVLGESKPAHTKKNDKRQKKKKLKNVVKQVSKQSSQTNGDEASSKKSEASGGLIKKFKVKATSSFKTLKGKDSNIRRQQKDDAQNDIQSVSKTSNKQQKDDAQNDTQSVSKTSNKRLKRRIKKKFYEQQISNASVKNVEGKSTLALVNSGEGKSVSASPKTSNKYMMHKTPAGSKKNLIDSQNKMERLFEVKRKQKKVKKVKADKGSGPLLPVLHSESSSQVVNDKQLQRKLKRKAKKEKKKEALLSSNEVALNKSKKKKMHNVAKKVSRGKLKYLNSLKDKQGTTNPSFDTSLSESVTENGQHLNLKKKDKKKRKRLSSVLSDSVDGKLISSSSKFKLNNSINKEVALNISESNSVPDKPQKKKLVISKILQRADIFENTTSHDLKKKRRFEAEGGSRNSDSLVQYTGQEIIKSPKGKKNKQAHTPLRDKMAEQLKSARFRWLNEQLYTSKSWEALKYFKEDQDAFEAYHSGYRNQVAQWPLNPLDVIIRAISSMSSGSVVADFGCGEARLAESLPNLKVHSLDLVAKKPGVVACDMAHTPLLLESVDVAVFCLSLMGTNLNDFILEANRVLKVGGLLMIAEVESRFEDVDNFTSSMVHFGFQLKKKNLDNQMFIFMDFKKVRRVAKAGKLPVLSLDPCIYKKR